ncbi:MAG TPA: 50S ribosomal protein L23 [Candidatus Paceibacterota bacterium]|nr:50S ribosomal protein L23 [Candidatus Paceibacterota bacterium]
MGLFNVFKKKPAASAKRKQAGPPQSKSLGGELIKRAPMKKKEIAATILLKEPHISEKATNLSESGKYIFKVYPNANKSEIKKAIASLYGVVVKNVNIINIKTKRRIMKGRIGEKPGYKKAIITLEGGHKIEILPH